MDFLNKAGGWLKNSAATVSITACCFVSAHAQSVGSAEISIAMPVGMTRVQTVEGITEYRLANGLKVLLAPDVADDKVSVNLTYMVGSRHEGYGETGMAHLLEHLIFKGTPGTADPKFEFRKRGFTYNGTTNPDRTNYFATFVSNQDALDWYIGWQADAMVNSFIARKDLDSEMTVVRSELEIGENNPVQALTRRMASVAYMWHNYGKSTIGAKSDIENVDVSKLRAFYQRYYRPDNAALIVAGKFDVGATLASIQKSLGALTRPEAPIPKTYTLEPAQDGERSVVVRRPATNQVIIASYHTPAALHPDSIALAVLATALGDVPSGRLHKALVESRLAQSTFVAPLRQRETSSIYFGTYFGPDDDASTRQSRLLEIVENLAQEPIRPDEFERAKTMLNKALEQIFTRATAVASMAMETEVLGDWRALFVARDRLKIVSLDDVNRVARTYLLRDNRTIGHLIPTQAPVRAPDSKMPDVAAYLQGFALSEQGLESTGFDFGTQSLHDKVVFATTPAGIRTATLQKPVRGDLVQMKLSFKFGTRESLQNQAAAAAMASAMLQRGTQKLSRQQIADELLKLGAALNMSFSQTGGEVWLSAKKENFKAALELAVHLLRESSFPEAEFEEMRNVRIKGIEGQIKDSSAQADDAWLRYGNSYAKGDPRYRYTLEEWLQELKFVTRDQAREFHRRFYGAQNAQVTLLGPVDAREYQQAVASALDGWQAPEPWRRVGRPLVEVTPTRLVFDTPDKSNANLRAYQRVPLYEDGMEPDFYAFRVATRIVGGGPGSRLWIRLREREGLSYSVGASFNASSHEPNGNLSLAAEVAPANVSAAEQALREELARSLNYGFTATEVETFKRQLLADRQRERSGDGWAMGFMNTQLEFDLPRDRREKNDALIESFTAEHINTVWRKYLRPGKVVWGVFGDQLKIR